MVKILGAGLAGLAAAIKLADAGLDVTIAEKSGVVGKYSSDNQAIRNYEHKYDELDFFLQNGIEVRHAVPIHRIVKYAPSGKKMTVASEDRALFYSVQRGPSEISIEQQMYRQALKKGVEVVLNSPENPKSTNAEIITMGGVYNNIWEYGCLFKDTHADKETILFFMDNKYCPKGYIYLLPYGNEATLAATTFDRNTDLPKMLEAFMKENEVIKEALHGATFVRSFSGFEYANIPKSAVVKGRIIAGSAAGFIDPSRGFGIRYAVLSGLLAAQAVIEKTNYDKLWKEAFEQELLDGFKRRLLLEKMTNEDYERLIVDENVKISKYDKFGPLGDHLQMISLSIELERHRRKYELKRVFG